MTNSNKLADALREIQIVAVDADLRATYHRTALETISRMAREALAEHDAQPAPGEWQPIETAPKDGTRVLLSWDGTRVGYYLDNSASSRPWAGWKVPSLEPWPKDQPIAWMPMPAPTTAAPQPAPAPVQVDVLEPPGGNMNRPHRLMITSGEFWRCAHGLVKPPCRECDADFAHPPAPAADGACERPTELEPASESRLRPTMAPCEKHDAADGAGELPPLSSRLRPDVECAPWVIGEVRKLEAAIAALRQPVPDAVRELAAQWRRRAHITSGGWRRVVLNDCADELESALASQPESRNAD